MVEGGAPPKIVGSDPSVVRTWWALPTTNRDGEPMLRGRGWGRRVVPKQELPEFEQLWTGEVKVPVPSFAGGDGHVRLAISVDDVTVLFEEQVLATMTRWELRRWVAAPSPVFRIGEVVFATHGRALVLRIGETADPLPPAVIDELRNKL